MNDAWGGSWGETWLVGSWGGDAQPPQAPATGGGSWYDPYARRRRKRDDEASEDLARPDLPDLQPAPVAADLAAQLANALRAVGSPADLVQQWNLDALQRELLALAARQDAAVLAAAQTLQADKQRRLTDDELAILLLLSW